MQTDQVVYRTFAASDREQVVSLWSQTGLGRATNDPNKDIDRKMTHSPDGFLVAESDGLIVGTVMAGYEGPRGWINPG